MLHDMKAKSSKSRNGNWRRAARITVNTTKTMRAELEQVAQEQRRSISDIINDVLVNWALGRERGAAA
jgi:hypothetical protein